MSSSRIAHHTNRHHQSSLPRRSALTIVASLALLLGSVFAARPAMAATLPAPNVRDQQQYVFTMGVVARLGRDTVTLRFEDGQTETYLVNAATTFQTESGGASTAADLAIGDMVMIVTPENASIAITIVDAGDRGFDAGGPFDIGTDEGA